MFKKLSITIALVLVLAAGSFMPAFAQEVQPVDPLYPQEVIEYEGIIDETPQIYFVELTGKSTVDGGSLRYAKAEKNAFRIAARRAGLVYTERMAFDTLWNGISVKIDPTQLGTLMRLPGVKAVYPVDVIGIPETFDLGYDPELYTALAMTGADVAQSELGYTGAGIKVAVMDTGIDYDHPDLGGCFGPGCRVETGWDFVGDDFNADSASPFYNPIPVPDPDPDDCYGHGTHVAGIIGASGTVTGVAPEVTFGSYRVFGCEGSTTSDIMLAAMEMAFADRMDVLNISIGSAYNWPQYPTAVAASKMVDRGMVVVASIGNNGANGLYAAGAPGLGEKVIGVAAFDNTESLQFAFSVSPDDLLVGYNSATAAQMVPQSGTHEIVAADPIIACSTDGISPFEPDEFSGKLVLINRGTCSFYEKALNAQNSGAVGVILYDNAAGALNPSVAGVVPITIPVAAISQADGNLILGRITSTPPIFITWTSQTVSNTLTTGNLISSFSSYGLSPDLTLKPDIGAPGGNIWSTYPLEKGGYTNMGGTSMSSPHVAGAAALLLQAKPGLQAVQVRDVLQNSADPKLWSLDPAYGLLDNVHRQGAGMLDIDDAILATTLVTPAKISAGEGEAGPYVDQIMIRNNGSAAVTYELSYINALSTRGVITPGFNTSDAMVEFEMNSITVPAGEALKVGVTIHPATGPEYGQYGGYIVLTPQNGGQVYRVPFAGFVGDYQAIEVLAPTTHGFPWLAKLSGGTYFKVTGPVTYTLQGEDIPFVLAHFDHQSQLLKMEIYDAAKKKSYKAFLTEEYMVRNSSTTGFYAFAFDGYTYTGNKAFMVPDGDYVIKISVLKANGKANNPDHWEYWWSSPFTIDRP